MFFSNPVSAGVLLCFRLMKIVVYVLCTRGGEQEGRASRM
jgi:hypothetical protein